MERCIFDADDVDRIVRHQTLTEIDREIRQAAITVRDKSLAPEIKYYWQDRRKAFEMAKDVAEFCFLNDIPTNENADTTRRRAMVREKRLQEIMRVSMELQQQVQGLNNALANHLKEKPKKKQASIDYEVDLSVKSVNP